jgi:hypothetical protein
MGFMALDVFRHTETRKINMTNLICILNVTNNVVTYILFVVRR